MPNFVLPKFYDTITLYRVTAGVWAELGELQGQLYCPGKKEDDLGTGEMHYHFPKAADEEVGPWVLPRDSYSGIPDVAEVTYAGGYVRAFRVADMRPRWNPFDNAHLQLDLHRIRDDEWDFVTHQPLPGEPGLIEDLPVWNMEFTAYVPDGEADNYHVSAPFVGQLYCMQPMAEVAGYESMFAFVPKEVTVIPNPGDIEALEGGPVRFSYVRHAWNGRDWLWQVTQIVPRFANFSSEHWMLLLVQVNADDAQDIYDKAIAPGLPYLAKCTIEVSAGSVLADGTVELIVTVTVLDFFDDPVVGATVVADATSGSSSTLDDTEVTDGAGQAFFAFTNSTAENDITYQALLPDYDITIGPSDPVDWLSNAPYLPNCTILAGPSSVLADGIEEVTLTVTVQNILAGGLDGKTINVTADTGSAVVLETDVVTAGGGVAVLHATNTVAESGITFTAHVTEDAVDIGPSNAVDFDPAPVTSGSLPAGDATENADGDIAWTDVVEIEGAMDDVYGYADFPGVASETTNSITVSDFGFALPAGKVIYSITASIRTHYTPGGGPPIWAGDWAVTRAVGAPTAITPTSQPPVTTPGFVNATVNGAGVAGWTTDDINDSAFALTFAFVNSTFGSMRINVDSVEIQVQYLP